jgi:hypothetical protein
MSAKRISVRQTGPNSFAAISADGRIFRDNFPTPQVALMWAARRGLYQGVTKRKREARAIPSNLEDEQILGLPLLARLSNTSYPEFLKRAKAGEYGTLFQTGKRTFGLRFGNWKQSMAARQVQIK